MAKKKYERDFKGVWIPKEIWLNEDLTITEKVFLVEIDSLDNEHGCFASNDHFSKFFQLSKSRCSQIINALKKKGFVTINYQRDGKEIKKRVINLVRNRNTPIKFPKGGVKFPKDPYLENAKENNTLLNNTVNNTSNSYIVGQAPTQQIPYQKIISYLNEKSDRKFSARANKNRALIKARFNEGFNADDFKTVIDKKVKDWKGDTKMEQYLRPETLFGNKFDRYLNEKGKQETSTAIDEMVASEHSRWSKPDNSNAPF